MRHTIIAFYILYFASMLLFLPDGDATELKNASQPAQISGSAGIPIIPENSNSFVGAFSSSNLPIIVIDTHGQRIPDEPKISAEMGIIYNGPGLRNNLSDPFNNYAGKIGIEVRGSTSQSFPKQQYAVETRDAQGENLDVSLLGLPAENDWVLYAPYTDKSLMRNVLAYHMSNQIGRYASRTRFCELVLNGDYRGVYVLMEKIKRDKNRVNISKLEPTDNSGDKVTGGYIFKIDKPDGAKNDGWNSPHLPLPGSWQRIYYQYHYPDQDEITSLQKAFIQAYVTAFEDLMATAQYADPVTGYPRYLDLDSFVDYFILSELPKNIDAYRLSAFMQKDRDSKNGKLVMGPIWDYNLAFGNVDYYSGALLWGWQVDFEAQEDIWLNPFWWKKLVADTAFANRIHCRWHQLRQEILTVPRLHSFIDSLVVYLDESQQRNFQRWPILGVYVWPNAFIGKTFKEEVNYLKNWLKNRMAWMDVMIPGQCLSDFTDDSYLIPADFHLKQNYPNPFNPTTTIAYSLRQNGFVALKIYNASGQLVKTVYSGWQVAGDYFKRWDADDDAGQAVSPGVYFVELHYGQAKQTKKMLLLR